MTVVDVTGGVFGGCCQVTVVKLSILTCVKFTEQDGGPKMENVVDIYCTYNNTNITAIHFIPSWYYYYI